jgi:hypothetical protein
MRICYSGIKFFFTNVLKRDWHTLTLIHAKREQRLPDVLSLDEVRNILNAVRTPQNKAYLTTSTHAAFGYTRPCTFRPAISTATGCAFTSIVAKAQKIDMFPCRNRPSTS